MFVECLNSALSCNIAVNSPITTMFVSIFSFIDLVFQLTNHVRTDILAINVFFYPESSSCGLKIYPLFKCNINVFFNRNKICQRNINMLLPKQPKKCVGDKCILF